MTTINTLSPGTDNLPIHIGIIMDGNGRWAVNKKKPRTSGHREGLNAAKRVVKAASDFGIKNLTLYAFSTENWKRTEEEVSFLMKLISKHLKKELDFYRNNLIRVLHSGDINGLPEYIQKDIHSVIRDTADFEGLKVNLAINFGGRDEIIRGIQRWYSEKTANPSAYSELTEDLFSTFLDQPELPDADLIIRTGGEQRISNFLLWESAYSELYFSNKLWPDWDAEDLHKAILSFQGRERKFGSVN